MAWLSSGPLTLTKPLEVSVNLATTHVLLKIDIALEGETLSDKINHSNNKRKDILETRTALLIYSFKLEISGLAVQRIR